MRDAETSDLHFPCEGQASCLGIKSGSACLECADVSEKMLVFPRWPFHHLLLKDYGKKTYYVNGLQ